MLLRIPVPGGITIRVRLPSSHLHTAAALAGCLLLAAGCARDVPIPTTELPIGVVDVPQANAIVKPAPLLVGGWALGPHGVRDLEVYLGGELKGLARPAVARPDVAQAHPLLSAKGDMHGWNLEIDVGPARGPQTLVIRVRDGRGRVGELARVPIVIEPW